jgi:hypothetical protein
MRTFDGERTCSVHESSMSDRPGTNGVNITHVAGGCAAPVAVGSRDWGLEFKFMVETARAAGTLKACLDDPATFHCLSEMAREDAEIRRSLDELRGMLAALLD